MARLLLHAAFTLSAWSSPHLTSYAAIARYYHYNQQLTSDVRTRGRWTKTWASTQLPIKCAIKKEIKDSGYQCMDFVSDLTFVGS